MYQREGKSAYKVDLGNIYELTAALGNPQDHFKSIHVAGTNGKGSTSHILTAVFMKAGYKVGTYTSPHYLDFRERIKINGQFIPEQTVVDFVEQMQATIEQLDASFFEITVAMAFWYFAQNNVDIAIIEVGLGGRLDSTNIIHPELSIITNIGLDHQQFLGQSLSEIAKEKAGIIKKNVPVVIGLSQKETKNVFINQSTKENAPIFFADELYQIEPLERHAAHQKFNLIDKNQGHRIIPIQTDLLGDYQQQNIRTAFVGFEQLKQKYALKEDDFLTAVQHVNQYTRVLGRWQVINQNPLTIFDSSHNIDGIEQFFNQLQHLDYDRLFLIFGTTREKDVKQLLPFFPKNATIILTQAAVPRAMPVEELSTYFSEFPHLIFAEHPGDALNIAQKMANDEDIIAAFGSIFLISDLLQAE